MPSESIDGLRRQPGAARGAIVIMVKAGDPTDAVIDELVPLLEAGDIVVDCGNAHFADTRRREAALREHGLHFVGTGVSGGEEGALQRPEHHAGRLARSRTRRSARCFEKIAAQVDGTPCCAHVGPDGAGHFVKMVHNGIEYADMQLIAEAYDLLAGRARRAAGRDRGRSSATWNDGRPRVVPHRDHRRRAGAHRRGHRQAVRRHRARPGRAEGHRPLDRAERARPRHPDHRHRRGDVRPLAVRRTPTSARRPAGRSRRRGDAARRSSDRDAFVEDVAPRAVRVEDRRVRAGLRPRSRAGSAEYGWDIDRGAMATIWRGGCIIRARFLDRIREAYDERPDAADACWSRRTSPTRCATAPDAGGGWWPRGRAAGIPAPGVLRRRWRTSTGCARERLPAALIQGLRDNFGAHTYQRVDREGTFHTRWPADRTETRT